MTELITHIDQLTPERLTTILKRNGHLRVGAVTAARYASLGETSVSLRYRLQLAMSTDAQGENLPRTLFFRLSNPTFPHNNEQMADFYGRIAPLMKAGNWQGEWPIADCLDVIWSPEAQTDHLLLEDLTETHFVAESNLPPNYALAERLLSSFASLHAFWWEHPLLGQQIGTLITAARIDEFHAHYRAQVQQLADSAQIDLSPAEYAVIRQPGFGWPPRRRRHSVAGQGVTLVHRDPHPGNILYPRDPTTHPIKLVDWQSWRVDPATDDLAYQIAFHWPLAERRAWEEPLLRHYHHQLLDFGVRNYTWDDFIFDYRASIIRFVMIMVLYWRHPVNRKRAKAGLQAFVDWECDKILEVM